MNNTLFDRLTYRRHPWQASRLTRMPLANNQFAHRAPKQSPERRRRVAVRYGTASPSGRRSRIPADLIAVVLQAVGWLGCGDELEHAHPSRPHILRPVVGTQPREQCRGLVYGTASLRQTRHLAASSSFGAHGRSASIAAKASAGLTFTSGFRRPARNVTIANSLLFACDEVRATIQEAPCTPFHYNAARLRRNAASGR